MAALQVEADRRPVRRLPRRRPPDDQRVVADVLAATFEHVDPGPVRVRRAYRRGRYRASQITVQLSRYVKTRGDLGTAWPEGGASEGQSSLRSARQCAQYLRDAKQELERAHPQLAVVANFLGLADRMLVSLYSREILLLRLQTVQGELENMSPRPGQEITAVTDAAERLRTAPSEDAARERALTTLKDAVTRLHGCEEQRLLEDDLQVSRLNAVLVMVVLSWVVLVVSVPFLRGPDPSGTQMWSALPTWGAALPVLVGVVGLSVAGAVGGVVSGMLSVRDSRATLTDYRTSMRKLALRPAVGAVAAVVVYLFIAAGVVNGLEVTNPGVYVVAAFAAGFSERYFLRLVNRAAALESTGSPSSKVAERTATGRSRLVQARR